MRQKLAVVVTFVALSWATGAAPASAEGTESVLEGSERALGAASAPGCLAPAKTDTQRYIDWVASATFEELAATFGTGRP